MKLITKGRTLLIFISTLITVSSYSQVTIGSGKPPATAALLDLKSQEGANGGATTGTNGGGLLLPRVKLESKTSLKPFAVADNDVSGQKEHTGLMVYNLTPTGGFTAGVYTWDGAKWVQAGSGDPVSLPVYNGVTPITVTGTNISLDNFGVTTGKLADNSVTSVKIVDGAVTTTKIQDANVTNAKLSDNAVTTNKMANAVVTNTKLADNSVTSVKIVDETIATVDLANNAVTNIKLSDGAVTTKKIVDANVTNSKLADNSVTSVKIVDGTIATADLANNAVTLDKFANGGNSGDVLVSNGLSQNAMWTPLSSLGMGSANVLRLGHLRVQSAEAYFDVPANCFAYVSTMYRYGYYTIDPKGADIFSMPIETYSAQNAGSTYFLVRSHLLYVPSATRIYVIPFGDVAAFTVDYLIYR